MRRRHVKNHPQLLSTVGAALLVMSVGVTAQRFLPSLVPGVVPEKLKNFVPVTDDMLVRPKPENWINYRNGYSLWGYSSLNQINVGTVGQLRLAWSRAMQPGPQEVEPLVYDGIMFLVNSEDIVQALDATNGDLLWEYKRKLPPNIGNLTGTQFRYRNVSIYDDKIFLATNDAFQIALEARSGKVLWETQRANYKDQVAQTTGPIVVKGKLINGSRCNPQSPLPGGCFITAHDTRHGEELWRVYTAARPGEPGGDTWGGLPIEARRHSSAWMPGATIGTESRLLGNRRDRSPARKVARRGKSRSALHELHARHQSRYRQVGVVLPASAPGQLGPRSCLRENDRSDPGGSESGRGALDQPEYSAGRDQKGHHRDPRQDRNHLDARCQDGRVPVGEADDLPEHHDRG